LAAGRRLSLGGRAVLEVLEDLGVDVKDTDWAAAEDFGALPIPSFAA